MRFFCFFYAGYVGSLGDKPKVEIKGRFSVTSENVDLAKVGYPLISAYMSVDSAPYHFKEKLNKIYLTGSGNSSGQNFT
jgi:hypothetical protein